MALRFGLLVLCFSLPLMAQTQKNPEVAACQAIITKLNNTFNMTDDYRSYCGADFIETARKLISIQDELPFCVSKLKELTNLRSNLTGRCFNNETRKSLRDNTYMVSCLSASRRLSLGDDAIGLCSMDKEYRTLVKSDAFIGCFNVLERNYPNQRPLDRVKACKDSKTLASLNSKAYLSCTQDLESIGVSQNESVSYCLPADHQDKNYRAPILKCAQDIRSIVGSVLSGAYCFRTQNLKLFTDKAIKCVDSMASIVPGNYFQEIEKTKSAQPAFEKMLSECQNPKSSQVPFNSTVKFYGAKVLSNSMVFQDTRVGGLSGLSYDKEKNMLYAISDDSGKFAPTRFYGMSIDLSHHVNLNFQLTTELNSFTPGDKENFYDIDTEGIVVTKSGKVIASSETLLKGSKNYIKIYDSKGKQISDIELSDKFTPRSGKKEMADDSDKTQTQGVYPNKSFESLGSFGDEAEILYTANERPLAQDYLADHKIIRIVKLVKNGEKYSTESEFAYEIENMRENGIVDITAIDENHLLTLERSFDSNTQKVTVQLFDVKLKGARDYKDVFSFEEENKQRPVEVVSKRLLMNLNDILPFFPYGYRKIDNLEGMTFGPKLPNGHQSLILVSDNNFSTNQMTQVIVLEYTP
jgi:hypothetical protein